MSTRLTRRGMLPAAMLDVSPDVIEPIREKRVCVGDYRPLRDPITGPAWPRFTDLLRILNVERVLE